MTPPKDPVPAALRMDGDVTETLLRTRRFFQKKEGSENLRALHQIGGRDADTSYRDRWSYDKVVRSTHGINCTGCARGGCMSRTAPSPGRRSRRTTRRRGRTAPSTARSASATAKRARADGTPTSVTSCSLRALP